MLKGLLIASVSIAMMTACTVDEGFDTPEEPNEITFDVTADNASRQATAPNYDNITEFTISARHNGSLFINEESVAISTGKWTNRGKNHFWPADNGDVDFFAYKYDEPAGNAISPVLDIEQDCARLCMFAVPTEAKSQTTLQYATSMHRTAEDGSVPVSFSHALSEIAFNALNSSDELHVEISGVTISHVHMHGDFIFPAGRRQASWDVSASSPMKSTASFPAKTIMSHEESIGEEAVMHLIPQSQDNATEAAGYTDGTCITFRCAVWHLADPSKGVQPTDEMLIGEQNPDGSVTFGELHIPVSINWQPGCRYIYSVNFGAGGISGIPVAGGTMLPIAFSSHTESM